MGANISMLCIGYGENKISVYFITCNAKVIMHSIEGLAPLIKCI